MAIEYAGPSAFVLQEAETVQLTAHALDIRGDTLPGVTVVWRVLELDTVAVGISVDSLSGTVTAVAPGGPWRIQGRVESLRVDPPIRVTVTAAPDSLAALASTRLTVDSVADQSDPLTTVVFDLTTIPDQETPLNAIPVSYALVEPAPGSAAAETLQLFAAGDTSGNPHLVSALTDAAGTARAVLRRVGQGQPDSAIVHAVARTALGDTVPGAPVPFVVVFN